jgi:glucosamine--fructose-6-phosphate aminotransferase (isomerizing)
LLKGTYGLAVVSPAAPDVVIGARLGSPLVVGVGEDEYYLASDPSALTGYTRQVVYLEDRQVSTLTPDGFDLFDGTEARVPATVRQVDWEAEGSCLNCPIDGSGVFKAGGFW